MVGLIMAIFSYHKILANHLVACKWILTANGPHIAGHLMGVTKKVGALSTVYNYYLLKLQMEIKDNVFIYVLLSRVSLPCLS